MKSNKIHWALTAVLVTAALAAGPLMAEEVDLSGEASADGVVMIENIAGSIEVIGWDRNEVTVTGTLGDDVEDLKFKTGSKTRIEVVYPKKSKNIDEGADLVIHVPAGSDLEIECISASITVREMTGEIEAQSISGAVTVNCDCQEVEAQSISGKVIVEGGSTEVSVGSISGMVEASGGTAEVQAETVSGDIDLVFDKYLNLSVESVAGSADVKGDFDGDASIDIELHSGDLTLVVPANVSADFEIETFSGDIEDAFGNKAHKVSKYTPGKELEFSTGGGDARVSIATFSGDVKIVKK
jgi:DUF4097 and DUF4098 domain-containing protein YvlB